MTATSVEDMTCWQVAVDASGDNARKQNAGNLDLIPTLATCAATQVGKTWSSSNSLLFWPLTLIAGVQPTSYLAGKSPLLVICAMISVHLSASQVTTGCAVSRRSMDSIQQATQVKAANVQSV